MDIADIEASSTVNTSPPSHQFFKQDIVSESDVEHSVDRELLNVLVELSLGSWKAVQNNSLCRLWLLDFFVDDLDNDLVADQSTSFDDAPNSLDEGFVETAADGALQNFPDLIPSRDMVVVEVFSEEFGVGALANPWSPKEEEEFLFGAREVLDDSVGKSEHLIFFQTNHHLTISYKHRLQNFQNTHTLLHHFLAIFLSQHFFHAFLQSRLRFDPFQQPRTLSFFPGDPQAEKLINLEDRVSGVRKGGDILCQGVESTKFEPSIDQELQLYRAICTGAWVQNSFKKV